jgi:hypothetical protein
MPPTPLTPAQRRHILAEIASTLHPPSPALPTQEEVQCACGLAEIETHLDALVDIVRRSTATTTEPYLAQIFDDICNKCPHQQPSTHCPLRLTGKCQLCRQTAAIVAAVAIALVEMDDPEYTQRHPFARKQDFINSLQSPEE